MILEICIDSIDSAIASKTGGADRIEICSSLATGGTTPGYGLVKQCIDRVGLPAVMMIRPHDGPFVYRDQDLQVMLVDIEIAKSLGCCGVVFGCLKEDGTLHVEQCRRLIEAAGELQTVFHRAFDVSRTSDTSSPLNILDQIVELGFDRLLTSGRAPSADEGSELIGRLVSHAAGRIEILAGAGISADNVSRIVEATSVAQVHASASVARNGKVSRRADATVSFGENSRVTCAEKVIAIKAAITKAV